MTSGTRPFLTAVADGREGWLFVASGLASAEEKDFRERAWAWPRQADECLESIRALTDAGRDVWFTPGLSQNPLRSMDRRRSLPGRLLWADVDGADPDQMARASRLIEPGGMIVGSGRAPNHVHVYLYLAETVPAEKLAELNRRLVAYLHADASPSALNGLLRPVGTYNYKITPPGPVDIRTSVDGPGWDVSQLELILPAVKVHSGAPGGEVAKGERLPDPLPVDVAGILVDSADADLDRSERFYQLVAVCLEHGFTAGQTLTAAMLHAPSAAKYGNRLPVEVARAAGKVEGDWTDLGVTVNVPSVIPSGFRLWADGDDITPPPALHPDAFHGPVGEYLHLVEGETEGHPAAIGAGLLTRFGTIIGRQAQIWNGEHFHHPGLFVLNIGKTSTGAKGVAERTSGLLVSAVEPAFGVRHVIGGFGSGEALLDDIRDLTEGEQENGEEPREKRRVILEAEFARVLQVARREHNILSIIIRNAFDYTPIRHRTKTHGLLIATDHALSVEGAITPEELLALSAELDLKNGWLNRFMFFHTRLSVILPFGGRIDRVGLGAVADKVRSALDWLTEPKAAQGVHRKYEILDDLDTTPARLRELAALYGPWYRSIREGSPPLVDLTCRQHVHVPKLMLTLAVLDRSPFVTIDHFRAAKAWNDYSVATALRVFGSAGPPGKSGQLLAAIREAGVEGLDGSAQRKVFHDHLSGEEMAALRADLEAQQLIVTVTVPTAGRDRITSYAIARDSRS